MRIGTKFGLPKLGMTDKEYSSFQNWNKKSEKEKNEVKSRLAKSAFRKRD